MENIDYMANTYSDDQHDGAATMDSNIVNQSAVNLVYRVVLHCKVFKNLQGTLSLAGQTLTRGERVWSTLHSCCTVSSGRTVQSVDNNSKC